MKHVRAVLSRVYVSIHFSHKERIYKIKAKSMYKIKSYLPTMYVLRWILRLCIK